MIKIPPNPQLSDLLATFGARGGVIEFAFYETATVPPTERFHREAARLFLEEAAHTAHERLQRLVADGILKSLPKYFWNESELTGKAISFADFWGADHVDDCCNTNGFKSAFFWPPYNLDGRVDAENKSLFTAIVAHLFGAGDRNQLTIFAWNTDCSSYFDDGRDWWGTFFWTISSPDDGVIRVIAASATD